MISQPTRLSEEDFLASFEKVPRLAVNLIITDRQGKVLLTRRNIPPFKDGWHFPGSFVLKNESLEEALKRVARDEFGMELTNEVELRLLGVFDDLESDPRGHVVDVAYGLSISETERVKLTKETAEVKFFTPGQLPEKIGFNHRDTLVKLGFG